METGADQGVCLSVPFSSMRIDAYGLRSCRMMMINESGWRWKAVVVVVVGVGVGVDVVRWAKSDGLEGLASTSALI